MVVRDYLTDAITQNIGPLKGTPSGWQKRNCMLCHHRGHSPDKRERFGILYSPDGGVTINCFNCGFGTGWRVGSMIGEKMEFFLTSIGVPEQDVKRLKFESHKEATHQQATEFKLKGAVAAKWKEIDFLKECYSFRFWIEQECDDRDFLKVLNYTKNRGILDIDKMYWTPCREKRERTYNRRIVVPYYHKGKIVGFTGRLANDSPDKSIPKYMQEMPVSYIYGMDNQHDYSKKYIIISEGIFDAMLSDGIGTLHNNINEDQVALINSLPGEKILCPDRDKDGDTLIEIAIENKWSVTFPNWGRNKYGKAVKDIGEATELYGQLLTIKSIVDSHEPTAYNIRIKRKMDKINYDY